MADTYNLRAGQTISVTVNEGRAHVRCEAVGESAFTRSSVSFGPYLIDTSWLVDGDATVAIADYGAAVSAYVYPHAGAPVNAAQASVAINPTGDDNGLTFTARAYGTEGNGITVAYVDPGGTTAALSVSVYRQAIAVSLARAANAITTTAAQVKAAIEAHGVANELVAVAIDATDTGAGDDGSGIVTAIAATALENGAGTAIGILQPGGLLIDTDNGTVYRNSGTLAAPAYTQLADVA